ncbi:MAG: hypothetical protein WC091_05880 [Sulfuricellaceae bacterium]
MGFAINTANPVKIAFPYTPRLHKTVKLLFKQQTTELRKDRKFNRTTPSIHDADAPVNLIFYF